jgi:putative transposase
MRPPKYRINLTRYEKAELERIIRKQTIAQNQARRARIIRLANEEAQTNQEIAQQLGINPCDITHWTKRWLEQSLEPVTQRLSDSPRSGAPERITMEQWCQIIALACEPPQEYGLPITHWTHEELAAEAIKQEIVETISSSHVGQVLKKKIDHLIEAATG